MRRDRQRQFLPRLQRREPPCPTRKKLAALLAACALLAVSGCAKTVPQEDYDAMVAKRDAAVAERNTITAERDAALVAVDEANGQVAAIASERDAAIAERDAQAQRAQELEAQLLELQIAVGLVPAPTPTPEPVPTPTPRPDPTEVGSMIFSQYGINVYYTGLDPDGTPEAPYPTINLRIENVGDRARAFRVYSFVVDRQPTFVDMQEVVEPGEVIDSAFVLSERQLNLASRSEIETVDFTFSIGYADSRARQISDPARIRLFWDLKTPRP